MSSLPDTAEVVIVGGGVVGCSLAYHLTQHGIKPLLLERDTFGNGSTSRCAGGIRQQFGTEINVRLAMRSIELLSQFEKELGVPSDYRPIGYLMLAADEQRAATLRANVEVQRQLGVDVDLVDPARVTELAPGIVTDDLLAAAYCPTDGIAGPNEVTQGYASGARRAGAQLLQGIEVTGIRCGQDKRVTAIETTAGTVRTEMVINCAGPQAARIGAMVGLDVAVVPTRRHLALTAPFDGQPDGAPLTIDLTSTFYFRPESGGLLVGGSNHDEQPGEDTSVDWDYLPTMLGRGIDRLPALADALLKTSWAGLYEVTPDNQPLVGPSRDVHGFWLACGFSGHGFMMSPSVGESFAAVIAGVKPRIDLGPFDPGRIDAGELMLETAVN